MIVVVMNPATGDVWATPTLPLRVVLLAALAEASGMPRQYIRTGIAVAAWQAGVLFRVR